MSCMDKEVALRTARHHLEQAQSPELKEYWRRVIDSIERRR